MKLITFLLNLSIVIGIGVFLDFPKVQKIAAMPAHIVQETKDIWEKTDTETLIIAGYTIKKLVQHSPVKFKRIIRKQLKILTSLKKIFYD